MKKIAYIITQSEMGGAQKHVHLLCSAFKAKGYSVDVLAAPGGPLKGAVEKSGGRFIALPNMVREINPSKDISALIDLYRLFKSEKYDIVHSHSSKAGLIARIAAKFAGVEKNIYTAHGFVFNEPMSSLKRNIYIAIEYIGAKFGHSILAVSKKDFQCAIDHKFGNEKSIYYIPNAIEDIDTDKLKPKAQLKAELGIENDNFILGTVSNFYETKGHIYLITALKRLYDEGFKFHTIFAGEGPKFNEMKELCKDYNYIKFLGYRTDNYDLMNLMDLFVLPSVKEGMPYVILEAMSLKTPVLCTKVGALTDMIIDGENGFIVEPGDSEALYEKIGYLIKNTEELNSIGIKGKKFIDANFSFKSFIEKIETIYNTSGR